MAQNGKHCATTVIKKKITRTAVLMTYLCDFAEFAIRKRSIIDLSLFEQTPISIGRGTEKQFQIYGHPDLTEI